MQIERTASGPDTDRFTLVKIKLTHEDDVLDRKGMCATMYPQYEERINLKLNSAGLGFTLDLEEAEKLAKLLTLALSEFKE
jgi:hypothetical protein